MFATTHWSLVLAAGEPQAPQAHEALAKLCQAYWQPLYAFVRRQGHTAEDAKDLTQEFFARILQSNYFAVADRKRGKFRSFLLASLKHFLAHEWEKARAQKRGGGKPIISINVDNGETQYTIEPVDHVTAEVLYERRWALTLLENVIARLRADYTAAGKQALFEALEPALTGFNQLGSYVEIGQKLGLTEGSVKVAVHRLRQRYGEVLREEIAHTVSRPEEVEQELRHLLEALSQ